MEDICGLGHQSKETRRRAGGEMRLAESFRRAMKAVILSQEQAAELAVVAQKVDVVVTTDASQFARRRVSTKEPCCLQGRRVST